MMTKLRQKYVHKNLKLSKDDNTKKHASKLLLFFFREIQDSWPIESHTLTLFKEPSFMSKNTETKQKVTHQWL